MFLVVASALGTALAFLFPGLSFLVWFSLIPLFFLLSKKVCLRRAGFFLLFGAVFYGLAIHWVTHVTFLGFIFLVLYLSLFYLLFYFLGSFFIRRPLRQLAIPAAWVVVEFLKENIWCGFGWANLGYSQFRNLYLIQIADLGGAKLISFVIVMVNFLIWEAIVSYKGKKTKRPQRAALNKAASLLFIFAAIVTYSFFRLGEDKREGKINISLVQPNVLERQLLSQREKEEVLESLSALVKKTPKEDLVIFSEAAWPYTLDEENIEQLNEFVRDSKRDILIGAINRRNQRYYNSAFLFHRKEDLIKVYDKIILVPFGEYVPLRQYLTFIEVLNQIGDITPGRELTQFSYQGRKFSVLICFEDILPLFTARAARGRDFLVNITDDSWFGGNPEATQHLAIMVLRAVENRVSIVRAANTGISGWVSPQGRVEKLKKDSTSLFVQAQESFEVCLRRERSFYNSKKEWLVLFSFIFLTATVFRKKDKG